jgi:glutathione synthase/RimK-type ligase-like ATP-grasp enzyme
MVLLWGLPQDKPLERVASHLRRMDKPLAWVNQQETYALRIEIELESNGHGLLHLPLGTIDLAQIRGAYLRPYDFRTLERGRRLRPNEAAFHRWVAFEEALRSWSETTHAIVLNRFSAMISNGSKPFQAEIIKQFGFASPKTLITSDPDAALAFWEEHGAVIYKSMSGQRSVVARLKAADRARISRVSRCPTQFQEWIAGTDYRVHVVGNQVFACLIRSTSSDYRYDPETVLAATDIPDEVAERCYRVTRGLGLELSGVDLRKTPEDEWYCFEVNPSPGFPYYEDATGAPIGAAIASMLTS